MNYENAYKAVLQTAKQWIEDGCTDKERICLEHIFPELRESEDERIRKWIVNLLHELHYNQTAQPMALKAIEYLEKQKENPKSADSIPADCVSDVKCEDRSPKHSDSFGTDIRDTPAYWRGWDDAMEQKEQKPAEWSEEDKKMLRNCCDAIRLAKDGCKISADYNEMYNWLKSLRPSWKPSEVQMSMLLAVLNDPNNAGAESCQMALESLYEQLKKLM